MRLEETAGGRIQIVHVPKSIDNDLDLPHTVDTFGYQTARHVGVEILKNLMVDARTTSRWYFVIAMGRKAGHLALGIGKAGGATITLIPEEFRRQPVELKRPADTLVGSILKRRAEGRKDGVAVIAEGVGLVLDPRSLEHFEEIERDAHGHLRLDELNLGELLKREVHSRVRMVSIESTRYAIARRYMIRLRRDDFRDPQHLAKLAAEAGATVAEFRRQFEYLTDDEPPPLDLTAPAEPESRAAVTGP